MCCGLDRVGRSDGRSQLASVKLYDLVLGASWKWLLLAIVSSWLFCFNNC